MGKQSNKIQKRRRRLTYLERKKAKAREAQHAGKPKARRPLPQKKEKRVAGAPAESVAPKEIPPE
jgi:hypothetical protein